jgi:hypothetical protein
MKHLYILKYFNFQGKKAIYTPDIASNPILSRKLEI